MQNAIVVESLEKSYGENKVLKGISFHVKQGEIFALLGTNGAGKTTALECLEGLRKYNSGTIHIEGKRGVQLQSSSLPQNMKAVEAIRFFAKWQGARVTKEFLSKMDVVPFLNKQYEQLSTGQKRRLHLALALLGDPDVIFLDEPTAGLDVEGRVSLHNEIRNLKAQGKTIIMASHDMAEVQELCDRIAILKAGRIAFIGTAAELSESVQGQFELQIRFSKMPNFDGSSIPVVLNDEQACFTFMTESIEDTLVEIIEVIKLQDISIRDIKVEQSSLEQRFIEIAKEV